jgi:hypothetical protein
MSEMITLQLPEEIAERAREVAQRTGRDINQVLTDWIGRMAHDLPVDQLPDAEVLALAESQLPEDQQSELSDLLDDNREGRLTPERESRLDELMTLYRRGLVRKARALQVAVERRLIPPLS